jgi:hypothetical protein
MGHDAPIAGGEGTVGGTDGGREGGLDQGRAEPAMAMAGAPGAVRAGALVLAGAEPGPVDGMRGGGEHGHVGAELSHQHLGRARVHAVDRVEAGQFVVERRHGRVDLGADGVHGLVQIVAMGQELADEEGVGRAEPAGQRRPPRRELRDWRSGVVERECAADSSDNPSDLLCGRGAGSTTSESGCP